MKKKRIQDAVALNKPDTADHNVASAMSVATATLISILLGLGIGFILLLISDASNSLQGLGYLFTSALVTRTNFTSMITSATPLILTGLAVAIPYKVGMFNIGGPGQFILGGVLAIISALAWKLPWYVSILLGAVGGAIVGSIPGLLKAFFNVNEVISAIMLNWMTLIASVLYFYNSDLVASNGIHTITIPRGSAQSLPGNGLTGFSTYMTWGIFIAIIIAVIMYVVMSKTKLGFELRATGNNKDAAKYAGINYKRSIIVTFLLGGLLAGVGGALHYLAPSTNGFSLSFTALPSQGFDGIAVALLGSNSPLGCIFAALFISYIDVAGSTDLPLLNYAPELITVVTGVIVYFASFAMFFRDFLMKRYSQFNFKEAWNSFTADMKARFSKKIQEDTGEEIENIEEIEEITVSSETTEEVTSTEVTKRKLNLKESWNRMTSTVASWFKKKPKEDVNPEETEETASSEPIDSEETDTADVSVASDESQKKED